MFQSNLQAFLITEVYIEDNSFSLIWSHTSTLFVDRTVLQRVIKLNFWSIMCLILQWRLVFKRMSRTLERTLKPSSAETLLNFNGVMAPTLPMGMKILRNSKRLVFKRLKWDFSCTWPGYTLHDHRRNTDIRQELNIMSILEMCIRDRYWKISEEWMWGFMLKWQRAGDAEEDWCWRCSAKKRCKSFNRSDTVSEA